MKRIAQLTVAGVLGLMFVATSAQAQAGAAWLFASGGISSPTGDYKAFVDGNGEGAKTGWMGSVGLGYNATDHVMVGVEGQYGENKHKVETGAKTRLMGGNVWAGYNFGTEGAKVMPYVMGGAGFLGHKQVGGAEPDNSSNMKFAWFGGAGLYFPAGSRFGIFVDGRYQDRDGTTFIYGAAGFTIGLAGGGN
jgi:opacity protein-like surface antigen